MRVFNVLYMFCVYTLCVYIKAFLCLSLSACLISMFCACFLFQVCIVCLAHPIHVLCVFHICVTFECYMSVYFFVRARAFLICECFMRVLLCMQLFSYILHVFSVDFFMFVILSVLVGILFVMYPYFCFFRSLVFFGNYNITTSFYHKLTIVKIHTFNFIQTGEFLKH